MHTEEVWRRYGRHLHTYFKHKGLSAADSDDLVQNVFESVHQALPKLRNPEKIDHWLLAIARREWLKWLKPKPDFKLEMEDEPADDGLQQMASGCVRAMTEALPATYREAVLLSELENVPQHEVAKRLGLGLSAAKSRIQRGRSVLRKNIAECCRVVTNARGEIVDAECANTSCAAVLSPPQ